jgi:hypothetical protein
MRFDNGAPWASSKDLPTAFALWLVGLGITPLFNYPYRPTENPKVERCNGLFEQWLDPATCPDFAHLEQQAAWLVETQRERYPLADGRTRRQTFPELVTNERTYRIPEEERSFDMERVKQYLAQGLWPRVASKVGQIHLYGKAYHIGKKHAKETVWVKFDATTTDWVVLNRRGQEVKRHPAQQITAEKIRTLKVANPRPPSRKRRNRHNSSPQPVT